MKPTWRVDPTRVAIFYPCKTVPLHPNNYPKKLYVHLGFTSLTNIDNGAADYTR